MKALPLALLAGLTAVASAEELGPHLTRGAAAYAQLRPSALLSLTNRLGLSELSAYQEAVARLHGIDPLKANLICLTGLDPERPIGLALDLSGSALHVRAELTVKDPPVFEAFARSALQPEPGFVWVDPGSALGAAAALFTFRDPKRGITVVARKTDHALVIDALWSEGKSVSPQELVHRIPIEVAHPFVPARGATRAFSLQSAAVLYVDGRKLGPLTLALAKRDLSEHSSGAAKQKELARLRGCEKAWALVPPSFDDLALSLSAVGSTLEVALLWGTQSDALPSRVRFHPLDDHAVDVQAIDRAALFSLALYSASLSPFEALKHPGPLAGDKWKNEVDKCKTYAGPQLLVRSWPAAVAAATQTVLRPAASPGPDPSNPSAPTFSLLGKVRSLVVMVADVVTTPALDLTGAASATLDKSARPLIESLLSIAGATATPLDVGDRHFALYKPDPKSFVALADFDEKTLLIAFATKELLLRSIVTPVKEPGNTTRANNTLATVHLDSRRVANLPMVKAAGAEPLVDWLRNVGSLDAALTTADDLFRFALSIPFKQ